VRRKTLRGIVTRRGIDPHRELEEHTSFTRNLGRERAEGAVRPMARGAYTRRRRAVDKQQIEESCAGDAREFLKGRAGKPAVVLDTAARVLSAVGGARVVDRRPGRARFVPPPWSSWTI
jgi:hypothetical protein